MKDERIDIFEKICKILKSDARTLDVSLTGSLAQGNFDQYSDIDIQVVVSNANQTLYFQELPLLLSKKTDIAIMDPSLLLLPHLYVFNFFLRDLPIFWQVDIQVSANPHNPCLTTMPSAPVSRGLKLWVLYAKYFLRGNTCDSSWLEDVFQFHIKGTTKSEKLTDILNQLSKQANAEQSLFIEKCRNELLQIKKNLY